RLVQLRDEQILLNAELKALATKAKGKAAPASRLAIQRRLAEVKELINQLNSALRDVRRQIVHQAQLVAATAHQCTLELLENQHFDVVVIDEASMLPAALAMLVAGLGSGHTVVAGDFRQLGPVAVSDTPSSHKWLHD
ncbi:helicase, partial [Streptomyces sp. SID10244]|nr:helicase [Streptomyces sp. SID10244]